MHSSDLWYLTVVRTQGLLFIRPEKSWRPVVSVSVVDPHQSHEVVLGSDGQNPNLKTPFVLHEVDHSSQLDIKVWHKSHSKSRKKRHLVGSAYIALGELVRKQERPGSDLDLRLSCPPPQKKSPTIGGRQQHGATLTIRLFAPSSGSYASPPVSASASEDEDDRLSDASSSKLPPDTRFAPPVDSTENAWAEDANGNSGASNSQLRRRRKTRMKGYLVDSDEAGSTSEASSCPPTPRDDYFPPHTKGPGHGPPHGEREFATEDGSVYSLFSPASLPQHASQISANNSLSLAEVIVDSFSPYRELQHAVQEADYEKVLGRLLTEWYVVGASLLALAGIDAAIFGLAPGSILPVDSFAQHVVAVGAIAAGLGVLLLSWFLLLYSGANAAKFERLATDVYGSHFFFCLTCRIPTMCMFISVLALTIFLLTVAWSASPSAVLVMSFLAGVLFTLQYLVFGCHRIFNFCMWVVRWMWSVVRGKRDNVAGRPHTDGGRVMDMQERNLAVRISEKGEASVSVTVSEVIE